MLKETLLHLLKKYTDDLRLADELWNEVKQQYSGANRHYHTLAHLENVLQQLLAVKELLQDWDCILFGLYYHDIIYNPLLSNNEAQSADFAQKRMQRMAVDSDTIARCKKHIVATQSHQFSAHSDTNFFTDADLSILGQSWEEYSLYSQNVRKEYAIYPDMIYKPGRKKVLNHFLTIDRIYKTDFFYGQFESQAKQNISRETDML